MLLQDNNNKEIDLVILENGKAYPVRLKKSANPGKVLLNMILSFGRYGVGCWGRRGCLYGSYDLAY